MSYNLDMGKYKFYHTNDGKTVAVSSYCKKPVRGTAKCDVRDTFDPGIGEKLAAARCNSKVAHKRRDRAFSKYREAVEILAQAQAYLKDMERYYNESFDEMIAADNFLIDFEENL